MTNDTGGPRNDPPRFIKIDRRIMELAADLGAYAVAVYNCLAWHADRQGQCYPSHDTIASEIKVSKPTVIKALLALREAGLVRIEERKLPVRGQATNVYTLASGLYTGVNVVDSGLESGVNVVDSQLKTEETGVNVVYWGSQPGLPRSENPRSTGVNVVDSNKKTYNKTRINKTPPIVAHASQNGGGGGDSAIEERLKGFTFTERQIEDAIHACGDRLTHDVLDQWEVVIQHPPKGLDNPTGTMVSRLTRGNITVPLNSRPKDQTNGKQPASLSPEQQQTYAQEKAVLMERLTPPRIKL